MFNSIEDRALSEHRGSGIFNKKSNGKYSLFLPVTGTGDNGATPNQLDKTAIGNSQSTSVEGRQDNPQKTIPFFTHRDNIRILESVKGKPQEFLRVLPDFTAFKYSGTVTYMASNTDVGSLEQGEITITPNTKDEYVDNCFDLIEDTAIITNSIEETVVIDKSTTETYEINVTTNPEEATLEVDSETKGVATVEAVGKKVTITPVSNGTAIITITTKASNYASLTRTVLVVVKNAE